MNTTGAGSNSKANVTNPNYSVGQKRPLNNNRANVTIPTVMAKVGTRPPPVPVASTSRNTLSQEAKRRATGNTIPVNNKTPMSILGSLFGQPNPTTTTTSSSASNTTTSSSSSGSSGAGAGTGGRRRRLTRKRSTRKRVTRKRSTRKRSTRGRK